MNGSIGSQFQAEALVRALGETRLSCTESRIVYSFISHDYYECVCMCHRKCRNIAGPVSTTICFWMPSEITVSHVSVQWVRHIAPSDEEVNITRGHARWRT